MLTFDPFSIILENDYLGYGIRTCQREENAWPESKLLLSITAGKYFYQSNNASKSNLSFSILRNFSE